MKENPKTAHRGTLSIEWPQTRETQTHNTRRPQPSHGNRGNLSRLTSAGLSSVVSEKDAPVADGVVVCCDPPYARAAIGVSVTVTYGFETEGKEDWYSVADTTF